MQHNTLFSPRICNCPFVCMCTALCKGCFLPVHMLLCNQLCHVTIYAMSNHFMTCSQVTRTAVPRVLRTTMRQLSSTNTSLSLRAMLCETAVHPLLAVVLWPQTQPAYSSQQTCQIQACKAPSQQLQVLHSQPLRHQWPSLQVRPIYCKQNYFHASLPQVLHAVPADC